MKKLKLVIIGFCLKTIKTKFKMNKIKISSMFFVLLFITSCALKPIPSEYIFIKTDVENIKLDDLGNGNVLIYNGSNVLHNLDNTGHLNIWLDDKPLGQIRQKEYLIIKLNKGKHLFKVLHVDIVKMKSQHEVEIDDNTKIIRIKPTVTSNKLELTNEFPKNFYKFKYVEKLKKNFIEGNTNKIKDTIP